MRTVLVAMCVAGLALAVFVNVALGGARSDDDFEVAVSPQTLILNFPQGGAVKVHTDIKASLVDRDSLALNGVPATVTGVDACGDIIGLFNEDAIEAIVEKPETVLTLTGLYVTGESFAGSDTVRVIEK